MQISCTPAALYALARSCFYQHNCSFILPDDVDSGICPVVVDICAGMVDGDDIFADFPYYRVLYSVPHAPSVQARISLELQYMDYYFLFVNAWADGVQLVDLFFTVSPSQIERFGIFLMSEP